MILEEEVKRRFEPIRRKLKEKQEDYLRELKEKLKDISDKTMNTLQKT